ncbi:MAG: T9SS type A sorting domain-containing protein [Bacteroidetes bacterium]|nr:T9SS type A sorting domain-containing protein [Bacteroidota bacterium]
MKRLFALIAITIFLLLSSSINSSGQVHLHIVRIDSFPQLPGDTAFEGQVYSHIEIVVTNTGNTSFFGDIHVALYSQNIGLSGLDTLRDGPLPPVLLQPGDTVPLHANPNYSFRAMHYAAGDNIIVVWPYAASGSANFDTYQTHVYFALTVGIEDLHQTSFVIYPNPVSGILHLSFADITKVEQVRIYDVYGEELNRYNKTVRSINFSNYRKGIYFLELTDTDGNRLVKKLLVTGN